jgi:hypothetical protein
MGRALELAVLNSPAEPPQNYDTLLRQTSSNAHFFLLAQQPPPVGQGLLIHEVSRSHSTIFEKKDIEHKVCVLILASIFV